MKQLMASARFPKWPVSPRINPPAGGCNVFLIHLRHQRDYAVARLNQIEGVTCHAPEGTFVLFPDVSSFGMDPETLVDVLRQHYRVALVPGSPKFFGPGAQGRIRLSFATSREILSAGLDRLEAGLSSIEFHTK